MRCHVPSSQFQCDHCDYRATTAQNIRKHIVAKHTQQVNVNVASSLTTTTSSVAVAVGPLQSPIALPIIGGMRSSSSGDVLSSSFPMNSETFPLDAFFEFESELPDPNWTEEEGGGDPFPQIPPSLMNFLEHQPNHNDNNKRPRNEEDDGSATSSSSSSSLSEPLQVTKRIKI